MRLMQLIGLRKLLPRAVRGSLLQPWHRLLRWEHGIRERSFYKKFVRPGDLVFDIGANIGDKTRAFLSLGAHVVAAEPNPQCASILDNVFRAAIARGELNVEKVAVSSGRGELTLTSFSENSEISSGSAEFLEYAVSHGFSNVQSVTVPTIPLDELIFKYGLPSFIKIDVEGMDLDVLRGLTRRPKILSFEYHRATSLWARTLECFREIERLEFREANVTKYADPRLILAKWIPIAEAPEYVCAVANRADDWGDILVR